PAPRPLCCRRWVSGRYGTTSGITSDHLSWTAGDASTGKIGTGVCLPAGVPPSAEGTLRLLHNDGRRLVTSSRIHPRSGPCCERGRSRDWESLCPGRWIEKLVLAQATAQLHGEWARAHFAGI